MLPGARPAYLRLQLEPNGRLIVIGPPRGRLDLVTYLLELLAFRHPEDIAVVLGDVCDGHLEGQRLTEFLFTWPVYLLRGDHEELLLAALSAPPGLHGRHAAAWLRRGGGWASRLPADQLVSIAEEFARAPYAIEVRTRRGPVGLLHGDLPPAWRWRRFLAATARPMGRARIAALVGRERLALHRQQQVEPLVPDLWRLVSARGGPSGPRRIGNTWYLHTRERPPRRLHALVLPEETLRSLPMPEDAGTLPPPSTTGPGRPDQDAEDPQALRALTTRLREAATLWQARHARQPPPAPARRHDA